MTTGNPESLLVFWTAAGVATALLVPMLVIAFRSGQLAARVDSLEEKARKHDDVVEKIFEKIDHLTELAHQRRAVD